MKKSLTILLTLIIACNSLFAAVAPNTGIYPAQANANITFNFTYDASDAAKNYAGFYKEALIGGDSVAKLENLSNRQSFTGPVTYDINAEGWKGINDIYAICGTNFIPVATKVTLTLNPFTAAGNNPVGYDVKCAIGSKCGEVIITNPGNSFDTQGGTLNVTENTPAIIDATIKAKDKDPAEYSGQISTGGENGILELRFYEMIVNTAEQKDNYNPTYGSLSEAKGVTYSANWTFLIETI